MFRVQRAKDGTLIIETNYMVSTLIDHTGSTSFIEGIAEEDADKLQVELAQELLEHGIKKILRER